MRKLRGSAWVWSWSVLVLGAAGCGDDTGDDARDAGEGQGTTKPGGNDGGGGRAGGASGSSGSGGSKPGGRDSGLGGRDGSITPEPDSGHLGHGDSGAPECTRQSDCPLPESECAAPVCRAGHCETNPLAEGKRASAQTAGDCLEAVCDGAGAITMRADDTDVADDGMQCTVDACSAGSPTHAPAAARSACNEGGGQRCDDAGHCVECTLSSDCGANICQEGACRPPLCGNLVKDPDEGDVDCGGTCAKCGPGQGCADADDCKGNECGAGQTCVPNCADQVKNNSEVAIDCGPGCSPCSNGTPCSAHAHCSSGFCHPTTDVCTTPTCNDQIMNQNETGQDCGGVCPACQQSCTLDSECTSGICYAGFCRESVNGCTPASATAATTVMFANGNSTYSPKCIKVTTGTTVTFTANGGGTFGFHPLTGGIVVGGSKMAASSGPFFPATSSGTTKDFTLLNAGSYPFYCNVHGPDGMNGAVFVVPP